MKILVILVLGLLMGPVLAQAEPEEGVSRIAKLSDNLKSLQERIDLLRGLKAGDEFVFSTYILSDDFLGRTLMKEFADAAKRGVQVRGIVDPSHTRLDDSFLVYLEDHGVRIKEFHPMQPIPSTLAKKGVYYLNNRSHDKIWAVKRARPDGGHDFIMIEGSRNLLDAHFGLDPTLPYELEPTLTEKAKAILSSVTEAPNGSTLRQRVQGRLQQVRDEKYSLGRQYRDLDFVIEGPAAQEVFDYHGKVFETDHVKPRTIGSVHPLTPLERKKTAEWIARGHEQLIEDMGIFDKADTVNPLKDAIPAKIRFYSDTMQGNVPQGSEQALIDGLKAARAGDQVAIEIAGRKVTVPFTAELFRTLEKAKIGQEIEIGGKKVALTEGIRDAFAAARPADEVHMMSQYGILTPNLEKAFTDATGRGVSVKLLVNGPGSMWDGALPIRGYEKTYKGLVATGVQVMEYVGPEQVHAKAMTISNPKLGHQNGITVTGSSNMDPRSLTERLASRARSAVTLGADKLRNSEINYLIDSPQFTHYMQTEIELAMATAKTVAKGGKAIVARDCPTLYQGILAVPFLKNIL